MIILRDGNESDHNFVLSTWLKSYLTHGNFHFKVPGKIYFKEHQELIKNKLSKCRISIATTTEDESQIVGYVVHSPHCIHYLYVKNVFRGFKVAKKLLETTSAREYSHHTSYSEEVTRGLTYNPYHFYK